MPRTCTICRHEQRQEIDEALVAGESFRSIAFRFDTSHMAVRRHKEDLSGKLVKAAERREERRADSLVDQIREDSKRDPRKRPALAQTLFKYGGDEEIRTPDLLSAILKSDVSSCAPPRFHPPLSTFSGRLCAIACLPATTPVKGPVSNPLAD